MKIEFYEEELFTFDRRTVYQVVNGERQKTHQWTLLPDGTLQYEVFAHTVPNVGSFASELKIHKVSPLLYEAWKMYLSLNSKGNNVSLYDCQKKLCQNEIQ